jgi:hypothetical protein
MRELTDRLSTQASQNMMLINALTVRLVTDLITEIIYDNRPTLTDINPLEVCRCGHCEKVVLGGSPFSKIESAWKGHVYGPSTGGPNKTGSGI